VLGSCADLKKSHIKKVYYVLEVQREGEAKQANKDAVLSVRTVQVVPYFQGKELVYRTAEQNYDTDYYHRFFISPEAMITEEIKSWFSQAGIFGYVLDAASLLDPTHVMEAEVTALYGDYREKGSPKAVFEIRVVLLDLKALPPRIVFEETYRREVPIEKANPQTLVDGWNNELQSFLEEFEEDIKKLLAVSS